MKDITIVPEITEETTDTVIDLLDRQPDIDRIKTVIDLLSKQRKSACFAINGVWGVGKSHMLNMLEQQIEAEADSTNQYIVFHYNCWQYDYYEEPLIAIVASILDTLDEKENLIPANVKENLKAFLKIIGGGLATFITKKIADYTDIELDQYIKFFEEGRKLSSESIEKSHEYDPYFAFKKVLNALQETIQDLSSDKTVLFIVDELDRCLPEYAIKVIERLHHIFYDIPNVQVILSIDRTQFERTIKNIYGEDTDTKKYLAKFIKFEIKLNEGTLNDQFNKRFSYYTSLFSATHHCTKSEDVEEFISIILDGIDIRRRIEIIDKCFLIHGLLKEKEDVMDSAYMCIEVLLTILSYFELDKERLSRSFNIKNVFDNKVFKDFPGFELLNEIYKPEVVKYHYGNVENSRYYNKSDQTAYITADNIWGVILAIYRYIIGKTDDNYSTTGYHNKVYDLQEYGQQFWNLLDVIN